MSEKYAVMPLADYEAACDAFQEKTGSNINQVKSGELPEKINEVFEKGKQAEQSDFWDTAQKNGTVAMSYTSAFQSELWTDETYNPRYKIYPTGCNQMFYGNKAITDTKVEIDLTYQTNNRIALFYGASNMVTIRKIKSLAAIGWDNSFLGCTSLKNITFEGEIGRTISFQSSPLTPVSMRSVIEHLVNYAGTSDDGKYTVTFTDACWGALEADLDNPAPYGITWREYVTNDLGWLT